uniref:Biotin-protein ligase N-terminal domain-containing protein n=1 Tax=Rhodosorus marinus TaxID=101924 RepID=A0A7S2ZF82_9RHOD|mmetsp:Transcript_14840/g.60294  ORF Transcript_14840/g.60294 Transcript_14840/m.60294 type:complete len:243 (+) Transcript_14840:123-851(+)
MTKSVLVYGDQGVSLDYLEAAVESIEGCFPHVQVRRTSAAEIRAGGWEDSCLALVVPGGRDRPYCEDLSTAGTDSVRSFVKNGGLYYGFCAGAYFASKNIVFEPGTENEIVESRPLNFFPGTARGSIVRPYRYNSTLGAALVRVTVTGLAHRSENLGAVLYSDGGCAFITDESDPRVDNVEVLASYSDSVLERQGIHGCVAAVVRVRVENGVVVLSGVHPEVSMKRIELWQSTRGKLTLVRV